MSCLMYYKGKINPTDPNPSTTGNPMYDFFMGIEISPRLGKYDVKSSSHGMCTVSCVSFLSSQTVQKLFVSHMFINM